MASGCALPRPHASHGQLLALAPQGPPSHASRPRHVGKVGSAKKPPPRGRHAHFPSRHVRPRAALRRPASGWRVVAPRVLSRLFRFASGFLAVGPLGLPRGAFPLLAVGFQRPEGHAIPGKRPQPAQGPKRARSLAARRPPFLPALPGATESALSERDLREHGVRAQRFRFSEDPGLGAEGAVLEVCVPQVRVAAPAGKRRVLCAGALALGRVAAYPGRAREGCPRLPALGWTLE